MEIKDDTIYFLSSPDYFEKEKSGIKPNSVRFLYSLAEVDDFVNFHADFDEGKPSFIQIENKVTGECFKRKIVDISQYPGMWLYIISWEHYDVAI